MMLMRIVVAAALAAMAGTIATASDAEAGSRWRLRYLNPFYYTYDPRPLDLYSSEYGDEEYDDEAEPPLAYYDPDDDYYEPRFEGEEPDYIAPKKKKSAKKAAPAPKPVAKKQLLPAEKKVVATPEKKIAAAPVKKDAATEEKPVAAASGMSCDKAERIVSGYGFTSVKPTTCTGQVFAFNATRSGKAYVIKLSSASGELTEVKKVQ